MTCSYSSDENKSGGCNPCCVESEEVAPTALMNATADLNAHEADTIRPIGLNDFRKYSSVRAVKIYFKHSFNPILFSYVLFSSLLFPYVLFTLLVLGLVHKVIGIDIMMKKGSD